MDRKEFEEKIKSIGTCEDEVKRREDLTSLNDETLKIFDDNETFKSENERLKAENERLIESNRKYFMRLESQKTEKEVEEDSTGIKKEEKKEYKSYDEIIKNMKK